MYPMLNCKVMLEKQNAMSLWAHINSISSGC